ncbi:hypothetical protein MRQ36_18085 [Micromonospora sp. R77]|uniref:hypothetical protein n=1 Tax=Micromonospora sp. R77 TaxID=2925836 RepID=UPI001F61C561|nr:hypothetical protein [Micromonospora sp. R77]MCI4064407.1 hypothetical protein [Micromonospora sp. R77]
MSVRRHVARLAAVGVMLGGLVAAGASPASADGDRVAARAADSFPADGSPRGVAVEVRKRTDGCVLLRTALGLRLDGVQPNQVQVQVNAGGQWFPVGVSGGGGTVRTAQTSPADPRLCKGKSITVRYRVAFLAGAPGGRLTVVGEASSALGRLLGRDAVVSRVLGAEKSPSPSPSPSRKPSPTPTPSASAVATEPPTATDTTSAVAAALGPATGSGVAAADETSGGSPIMWFGIALVLVGIALIVLLVRRNRRDKVDDHAADYPEVPLPRNPGGTTYRSGTPTGQVYGQQPAPPTPGVYGATPAPRPTGNVYGAPGSAQPGGEPPAAAGGDATTVMPRLPG